MFKNDLYIVFSQPTHWNVMSVPREPQKTAKSANARRQVNSVVHCVWLPMQVWSYVLHCFLVKLRRPGSVYNSSSFVAGGSKLVDVKSKRCALTAECVEASLNFGISKVLINSMCCNADLCNQKIALGKVLVLSTLRTVLVAGANIVENMTTLFQG